MPKKKNAEGLKAIMETTGKNAMDNAVWEAREAARMASRVQPVWTPEPWWQGRPAALQRHYAYVSTETPGYIAYTPSDADGARDRQVILRPGRYLTKFFAEDLSEWAIKHWGDKQLQVSRPSLYKDLVLRFTSDADMIVTLYEEGPQSCMSSFSRKTHPVRIYASPDLAIAYLVVPEEMRKDWNGTPYVTRCLVHLERKIYARIYTLYSGGWVGDKAKAYDKDLELSLATEFEMRLREAGFVGLAEAGRSSDKELKKGFIGARLASRSGGEGRLQTLTYFDFAGRVKTRMEGTTEHAYICK